MTLAKRPVVWAAVAKEPFACSEARAMATMVGSGMATPSVGSHSFVHSSNKRL